MKTDFIVIGSGLSGLTSALMLSKFGKVVVMTKKNISDGSTDLAQGGIAAVVSDQDTYDQHIKDTLSAGSNHNEKMAVQYLVRHGPDAIKFLEEMGVGFDKKNGTYATSFEGAHSYPRVVHAGDFTGHVMEKTLIEKVKRDKNISILENTFVSELIVGSGRCLGVATLNENKVESIYSRATILATGGLGQIYQYTTNPMVATGDGVTLAYRAGAKLKDLEFIQFHPTALKYGNSPLFLLSEALRGEGAHLKKVKSEKLKVKAEEGERFMDKIDPRGELAPRDIVARTIYDLQNEGFAVYLDIRHKGKLFLHSRFPNIYRETLKRGFDLASDLVPVTPVAHYSCGGVAVDLYGRTNIEGLLAFGEVSCTGVHGANRLASNSLLEAIVFPLRLPEIVDDLPPTSKSNSHRLHPISGRKPSGEIAYELRKIMWEKVGIVRKKKDLKQAIEEISSLKKKLRQRNTSKEGLELENMLTVSGLVARSALVSKKSLGAHYRES